jgi:hypothetical protein
VAGLRKFALSVDKVGAGSVTTGEALMRAADQIAALKDPTERARRVVDIFGKSGQKLTNLLMGGSDALKQARAETVKLGIAFSEVDALQVMKANDALTNMKKALGSVSDRLAIEISPLIEAGANRFTDFATSGVGAAGLVSEAMEKLRETVGTVGDAFDAVHDKFKRAQITVVDNFAQMFSAEGHKSKAQGGDPEVFADSIRRSVDRMKLELLELPKAGEGIRNFFDDLKKRTEELGKNVEEIPRHFRDAGEEMRRLMGSPMGHLVIRQKIAQPKGPIGEAFQFPGAKLRGSQEAFEAEQKFRRGAQQQLTKDGKVISDLLKRLVSFAQDLVFPDNDNDSVIQIP